MFSTSDGPHDGEQATTGFVIEESGHLEMSYFVAKRYKRQEATENVICRAAAVRESNQHQAPCLGTENRWKYVLPTSIAKTFVHLVEAAKMR